LLLAAGTRPLSAEAPGAAAASSSSAPDVPTVLLEYQERTFSVINWGIVVRPRSTPFRKEPASSSGKVNRGVLGFPGEPSNSIAFLWQRDTGKLFLDLNRNEDLTDDPAGVFSTTTRSMNDYATFVNIHLPFHAAPGQKPPLVDLSLWDYGSSAGGYLAVRSFWQGKLSLAGRDWEVGRIDTSFQETPSRQEAQLLLRPWARRNEPFSALDGYLDTFPVPRKIFFDGQAYALDWGVGQQKSESCRQLQLRPEPATLGELQITGKFIQRLILPDGPYLVVLDQPSALVRIPTGSYGQPGLLLQQGEVKAASKSDAPQSGPRFSVRTNALAVLAVGGPLTNSLLASRHGRDLRLDYRLNGVGGELYQLTPQDSSKPPEFAVFKNGKRIASGKFEFG